MTRVTRRSRSEKPPASETGSSAGAEDNPSTIDRILGALIDVILEGGLPGFSVQQVADRAGISHRTVYRHFPTREALLEGLAEAVGRRMDARGGMDVPRDLADVPRAVVSNFALFSRDARAVEAGVRFGVGTALETRDRKRRSKKFRELVKTDVRGIADADAAMAGAVLRQIASSRTWLGLREGGLSAEAAARAATWATSVLMDALHAGRTPASETLPTLGKGESE